MEEGWKGYLYYNGNICSRQGAKKKAICMRQMPSLFIALRVIGFAEQIINAGIVKAGKLDQNLSRDIVGADFVFRVAGLRHAQIISNLLLIQIMI